MPEHKKYEGFTTGYTCYFIQKLSAVQSNSDRIQSRSKNETPLYVNTREIKFVEGFY